jgi:branched-chain amino acid transport system permease protein
MTRTPRIAFELDRRLGVRGAVAGVSGALLAASLAIAIAGLFDVGLGQTEHDIVILFGINAILVVGLQTFVGSTGTMSFGHMAFVGLGAYTAGILTVPVAQKAIFLGSLPGFLQTTTVPVVAAVVAGGAVALACALVFGPLVTRLPESTASIVTFALLVVANTVFQNATSITRGNQTFIGVPQAASFGLVFGSLAAVVAIAAAFKWSHAGLRARAVREDVAAAEASGVRPAAARLWPFALSGFICGVGGALWAFDVTAFSPQSFYISQSIAAIAMMILGGYRSITGGIIGATVMSIWLELARHVENGLSLGSLHIPARPGLSQLLLGIALVVVLHWRPSGIAGARELQVDVVNSRDGRADAEVPRPSAPSGG